MRAARRRAWRILPPYWPALVFSLIIAWTIVAQPRQGTPTLKSVIVYGLLLQDVTGAPAVATASPHEPCQAGSHQGTRSARDLMLSP